jgi:hypothetical protein
LVSRRLTRALAATALGVGTLVPAATLFTQSAARADSTNNEANHNEGDNTAPFVAEEKIIQDGDAITLFNTYDICSYPDYSGDGTDAESPHHEPCDAENINSDVENTDVDVRILGAGVALPDGLFAE